MEAEIGSTLEKIKLRLHSDDYLAAIEAHSNEWPIKIRGRAYQGTKTLYIKELESFEVIQSTK